MALLIMIVLLILLVFLAAIGVFISINAHMDDVKTGVEDLEGTPGIALSKITASGGRVRIRGEIWEAVSDIPIKKGANIRVISMIDQLKIRVKEDS